MLIHTAPRFHTCEGSGPNVELVDLRIDELDVFLRGGKDLATRRPYPNRHYVVACRKVGQKAIDGILIESGAVVPAFTMVARWAVQARFIATHRVHYIVLDSDFDAVTDNMVLWESRWPEAHKDSVPASSRPRMQLSLDSLRSSQLDFSVTSPQSYERVETFPVPTIERERLLSREIDYRVPPIESAFTVPRSAASGRRSSGSTTV
jgi:hypothetical protein